MRNLLKHFPGAARLAARPPSRRVLDGPGLALATALCLAAAAPALAHHVLNVDRQASPQATVRDFLSAAVVDGDGVTACRYLSPRARVSFEAHKPYNRSCEIFFGTSGLTLGGLRVDSDHALGELSYRVVPLGSARRVIVSHGGQSVSLVLRVGSPHDLNEFREPPTPWRIDSSVAMLATPHSRPAADG